MTNRRINIIDAEIKQSRVDDDKVASYKVWSLPRVSEDEVKEEIRRDVEGRGFEVDTIGDPIPIGLGLFRQTYVVSIKGDSS